MPNVALTANRKSVVGYQDTVLYDNPDGCTTFRVDVPLTSPVGVLVNVDGAHAVGEGVPVVPGGTELFAHGSRAIKKVVARGDGGTATLVTYGAVSWT